MVVDKICISQTHLYIIFQNFGLFLSYLMCLYSRFSIEKYESGSNVVSSLLFFLNILIHSMIHSASPVHHTHICMKSFLGRATKAPTDIIYASHDKIIAVSTVSRFKRTQKQCSLIKFGPETSCNTAVQFEQLFRNFEEWECLL